MRRQTSKLLVLLLILAVAPATAGQRLTAARHGSGCPHDTARAAAAGNARTAARAARPDQGGTKIGLFDRMSGEGSPLSLGRPSGYFMP